MWPLRKRHEKSEFALLQTLSRLFHLLQFVKCSYFSLELNSEKNVSKFAVNFSKRKRKLLSWVHVRHKTWSNYFLLRRVMPLSECDLRLQLTLFWHKPPSLKKESYRRACKIRVSIRSTRFPYKERHFWKCCIKTRSTPVSFPSLTVKWPNSLRKRRLK